MIILLYVHPQILNCNCVKFHQYRFISIGEVVLTRNMDGQTDEQTDRVIP